MPVEYEEEFYKEAIDDDDEEIVELDDYFNLEQGC